ncbi:MAG: D-aminoacyl-tRNA deacylase [Bacillota bacterium]
MRAVIQRVSRASVRVDDQVVAEVGRGFLVLLGVRSEDTLANVSYLAEKVACLRVFEDEAGRMNLGLHEVGGEVLAISQFTLYGDTRKGRRPSFTQAACPEEARPLYEGFVEALRKRGVPVKVGVFGAHMMVRLENDGPVTLILDTGEAGPGRRER